MSSKDNRRAFLKKLTLGGLGVTSAPGFFLKPAEKPLIDSKLKLEKVPEGKHPYNGTYTGEYLDRVAFPIGGIGAGMFCIEGSGAFSHMSVHHHPEMFNEPNMFAALYIKGQKGSAKVLEGPVPDWKKFGLPGSGNGEGGENYG